MFAMLRYFVGIFFNMFFSWFSVLIFLWFQNLLMIIKTLFFLNPKLVCIFIKSRSVFFFITKLVYIFIKYRFVFFWSQNWFVFSLNTDLNFFQPQNWYVFYLNTDLNFFLKFFSFYEIADFEISKKELRVRLKSFFLICDACIISLSYEYESSFNKSHFFFTLSKTDLIFLQTKSHFL